MAITLRNGTSGTQSAITITITLPTYQLTDYIVLFISSNNGNAQTFGANVTATAIASASNRLNVWKIVPINGSQTSFTMTVTASSVFTWWVGSYQGVDLSASVFATALNAGNSATSPIEVPVVSTGIIANGTELVLSAASVNATATWTTTASKVFNTTAGNAALMINADLMPSGALSAVPLPLDRGLAGTSRNESSLAIVLQTTPNAPTNILVNPSFEDNAPTATGWETEGSTAGTPQFTKGTTGVTDGARVQNIQYAGQAGDTSKMFAIYQAPITAEAGDVLTFSLDASGVKTNTVMLIGIEDFLAGGTYISESDTVVTTTTSTPTTYTVEHTCAANTDYVAVYVQFNEVVSSSVINVNIDKAILTMSSSEPTGKTANVLIDGGWVAKPIRRWNGTSWVWVQ